MDYTNNLQLYKWKSTDKKIETIEEMSNNVEKIEAEFTEITKSLMEKVKRQKIFSKTYGTYDTAVVVGIMANEKGDDPKIQVLGLPTSKSASEYAGRDTVGLYVSNRSAKPLVTANGGTITYSSRSVKVTGITLTNFDKALPGMLVDTYHTPNRYTALIESIDVQNQTIYVQDGWYLVQEGGSPDPSIPPTDGSGFDINRLTKIWGINNNVFLDDGDTALSGVAEEIGLFNRKMDGISTLSGIDMVNFYNKGYYGFQVRKAKAEAEGFSYGLLVNDSDNGMGFRTTKGSDMPLRSELNGNYTTEGFHFLANGTLSKLRLYSKVFANGQTTTAGDNNSKIFILNKTVKEDILLPSPVAQPGQIICIINTGSADATLKTLDGKNFIVSGTAYTAPVLFASTSTLCVSDGNSWYCLSGSFDNLKGFFKQSGGTIGGATMVNGNITANGGNLFVSNGNASGIEIGSTTQSGTSYIDFHGAGTVQDYDVRVAVAGGDVNSSGKGNLSITAGTVRINSNIVTTIRTGTTSPIGSVTPDFAGQDYIDTTNKIAYKACGFASTDWKQTTI
jgi:hypothetical protein